MRFLTAMVGLMLWATAATATEAPLTDGQIQGFIATMPELHEVADKYDREGQPIDLRGRADPRMAGANAGTAGSPYTNALPAIRAHPAYGEVLSIVRGHGFADLESFAGIADRIIRAYVALEMGEQAPQMNAQMQQAIQQIKSSGMPADQQQKMIDMLTRTQQQASAYSNAPEVDKAALAPHVPALKAAMEQQR